MRHVIALDVGGTGMKSALVSEDGRLLHTSRRDTGRERGPDAVVETVLDHARELCARSEQVCGTGPSAVGVAVPGIVDTGRGVAVFAANLGWKDVPLRSLLTEQLGGLPVALGHDVRAGGLAEGRVGAARDANRFLFVPLGTGIAGAIGSGGVIEEGAHGSAGEIGHVVVRPGGPPCACGRRGCLERLASASAVGQAWAAASGDTRADAAGCAQAVRSGDRRAATVWQDAVDALADGLLTAVTLLDLDTLVIGGGLAEAGDTLFVPLREALARRLTFERMPALVPAALGDRAGTLGAGLLAWDLLAATRGTDDSGTVETGTTTGTTGTTGTPGSRSPHQTPLSPPEAP